MFLNIRPGKIVFATHKISFHRCLHFRNPVFELERTNIHLQHSENCLSGDEDDVARHQSSFDPAITNPERELQTLDKECKAEGIIDPLLFSPANLAISPILKEISNEGTIIENGLYKKVGSVKGWTRKGKLVQIKDVPGGPFDRYDKLREVLRKRASGYSTKYVKPS